ncbi:phage portal protein [Nocardioides terrisoli]|uniref:phage portal protein n=1 Tax=Nocardioides terrisoli TaxID=3388267 RepID=UPI00287B9B3F|nr:phage portal protein [Nocardioides marmorisolisilvae]
MVPLSNAFFAPIATFPQFPDLNLSDDELGMANWLAMRLFEQRAYFELRWLYYDAEQRMRDLGISISPTLAKIRPALGWTMVGVDALVHRTVVEGFRFPGATDVDDDLMGIWSANNLDAEAPMTHLEAFVSGRAYNVVGSGDDSTNGQPLITSESPMNMAVQWDARMRKVAGGVQVYYDGDFSSDMYGAEVAALYVPGTTIHMAREASFGNPMAARWEVTSRDDHGFDPPIVRMANRQRLTNRDGASEIGAAWMSTTDSACRTLAGMEVSRELHAAPRRYALGVTESAFQNPDGTPVSKLKSYMDMLWLLERDEEGNVPQVGEFKGSDPSTFTKVLDAYKELMSVHMGVPPSMMGIHADGNPASADAIRAGFEELTQRARSKQLILGTGWADTMRMALLIRDGHVAPDAYRIETDWRDPAPSTPAGTSDAVTKQITSGAIPATSDVTLKRLGYSAVERSRLAQDRDEDQGASFLQEIAHSLTAKAARVDKGLSNDVISPASTTSGRQAVPTPAEVFGGAQRNG